MDLAEEKTKWEKLLSCIRVRELEGGGQEIKCREEPRNPFERDCDRITYSYPFRRLQDKTQVIPLPTLDFVHTRLTHTLEVATVGRSLGRMAEKWLLDKKVIEQSNCGDIPAILTAACLAHDIGNPPFGHSGENSISEYFNFNDGSLLLREDYCKLLKIGTQDEYLTYIDNTAEIKCKDLQKFEGNAMGFRILNRVGGRGLNLTIATLGTFTKYPRLSHIEGDTDEESWDSHRASQKKYGVFYTEKDIFNKIADELGLIKLKEKEGSIAFARHPLAFLMEAADDICYRIIDLEDGLRIGRIPFCEAEAVLLKIAKKDNSFEESYYREKIITDNNKIGYLRSKCINKLIHECFSVFELNYYDILKSEYDSELLSSIKDTDILSAVKEIKALVVNYVYNWSEVLTLEVSGFEVLSGLVDSFIEAANICLNCSPGVRSKRAEKIYSLLPLEYRHISDVEEKYIRYMRIIDYVSGMSDSFALSLYRKIKGIQI